MRIWFMSLTYYLIPHGIATALSRVLATRHSLPAPPPQIPFPLPFPLPVSTPLHPLQPLSSIVSHPFMLSCYENALNVSNFTFYGRP